MTACAVSWCVCLADIGIVCRPHGLDLKLHPLELEPDEELTDGSLKCTECRGAGKCQECRGSGECVMCCENGHRCGHECDVCHGTGHCAECRGSGAGVRVRKIAA